MLLRTSPPYRFIAGWDEQQIQEGYGTDGTVDWALYGHSGAGSLGLGTPGTLKAWSLELGTQGILRGWVSGVGCRETETGQRQGEE